MNYSVTDCVIEFSSFIITGTCNKGNYVKKHECHVCQTNYASAGGAARECTECEDYEHSDDGICKNGGYWVV